MSRAPTDSCAVGDAAHAALAGAVGAAVHLPIRLDAMSDDAAAAMGTLWRELVDRALEAVKRVVAPPGEHLEAFVVIIAADVALSHVFLPFLTSPRPVPLNLAMSQLGRLRRRRSGSDRLPSANDLDRAMRVSDYSLRDATQ
jgi:hypothetical protein